MKRFNVRIYGLWIKEDQILISEELIAGKKITKFPGGGLEWGEGTIDALKREWMEEMGVEIEVLNHFYTTDYFQKSVWDESQVISIYYFVAAKEPFLFPHHNGNEHFFFAAIEHLEHKLSLPIDIVVGIKLAKQVNGAN